ncbi:DUF397 domain-containing protein [Streptomyces sp. DSM 44917]|uniref:DUF397 domain-containing protein n=1 Tax=Streptomyces boetiae TaxID=3075541 RepID=A0ABU2L6B3_9ACTN|nr:DUF397 domain-containing protein [Streptomyces sp. DSM 44917]MDT0306907.1 DUF397 domain-containing protein [Streptomyces sp. DSM 44917]
MTTRLLGDLSRAQWKRSTYSHQNGNCVEVAFNAPGAVAVRDSKEPGGPVLAFAPGGWQALLTALTATTPE